MAETQIPEEQASRVNQRLIPACPLFWPDVRPNAARRLLLALGEKTGPKVCPPPQNQLRRPLRSRRQDFLGHIMAASVGAGYLATETVPPLKWWNFKFPVFPRPAVREPSGGKVATRPFKWPEDSLFSFHR